jgi:heptosyltransferase-3
MGEWINELRSEEYDIVVNLTFSPFSSYLVHALSRGTNTQTLGYSRYNDGTLRVSDEISKYFYAQVGIGKSNRVHLADIFSSMIGIPYLEKDWMAPEIPFVKSTILPDQYIVVHLGASEEHKTLTVQHWVSVLKAFFQKKPNYSVVLIGSEAEVFLSKTLCRDFSRESIFDLVGKTEIYELFPVIESSQLLIGADSAPMHIASLTNTMTLNLSIGQVNFWETGPKSDQSYIYRLESLEGFNCEAAGQFAAALLSGEAPKELISRCARLESYLVPMPLRTDFSWALIEAIYFQKPFPILHRISMREVLKKTYQLNQMIIENIRALRSGGDQKLLAIISSLEDLIEKMSGIYFEFEPLFNWLRAEKVSIAPGGFEEVLDQTLMAHENFSALLRPYLLPEELKESHGTI